ncbi:MAG: 16S rRNA (cytidine(1402)-2'-O)-methyltransferase [Candidatus Levybacteria bacterium]|nr:16S rRNA (cytidine(1402)-2'-O)-methyltransferase [Candidatus Levybacteria bacterium]
MGILYIVATPIGNLDDITIRAVRILLTVDAIVCEDTRKTGLLLKIIRDKYAEMCSDNDMYNRLMHYTHAQTKNYHQKLISYYEQNEMQRIPGIMNALKNGLSIALVSDGGTPTISDPGFKLVREAIKEGIRVESIPGPTSAISALVSSGLPTDKFLFLGYPPRKAGHRKTFFENIKHSQKYIKATRILFEAPHKLVKTLEEMREVFGDMEIVIGRELTKVHEEIRRETISSALEHFTKKEPRGEIVILFSEK